MKNIETFLMITIAILALAAVTVLGQGYKSKYDVPPQTIEAKAIKEILKLPYYGVFDNISIQVEGDMVTLAGKVIQPNTKSSEKRVVEKIKGVSKVIDNIEVLPLSNFDNGIRNRTLQTLSNRGGLYRYFLGANSSVKIIVKGGNVTLEGYVANSGDANLMNILANGVSGVFSVTNNLIVEKKVTF